MAGERIEDHRRALQRAVGAIFRVSDSAVRGWKCPRNEDGTYDLEAVAEWWAQRRERRVLAVERKRVAAQAGVSAAEEDQVVFSGPGSPALEEVRREEAKIRRLKRLEMEGVLVRKELIHRGVLRISAAIRGAGDQLQKRFGPDALSILEDGLDAADREILALFGPPPDAAADEGAGES